MTGRRRIELLAPPFSGHLHPLLAIGRALATEHDVCVLSTAPVQPQVAAAGLRGEVLLAGIDAELRRIVDPPYAVGHHPLRLHRQFQAALDVLLRLHEELLLRYRGERPDLLIADFTLPVAGAAAEACGVPWWTSLPSPCVMETPDGPPAYFGGLRPARGLVDRLHHAVARVLVRTFKRGVFGLYRRRISATGIRALYRADGSEAVYSSRCVLALGLRELEFERGWPPAVRFLGPMLYTPPCAHAPPPFAAGRRHVLVTLGTHLRWVKDAAAARARALAAELPDVSVHFSDGDVHTAQAATEGNFHRASFVDYASHLARYDLVVHHGGAGVMYHCLAAGRPAIVHPHDYDQFDHAARLEAAGAGLWLRRSVDLPKLVRRALDDVALAAGARRLHDVLRRTDGERILRGLVAAALES